MKVSVIIKALNEEQRIAAAIQSALDAVAELGGEVILADSVSSDNTIAIASEFPITIVQLKNPQEKPKMQWLYLKEFYQVFSSFSRT